LSDPAEGGERLRGRLAHELFRLVVDRRGVLVADRATVYQRSFEQQDRVVRQLVEELVGRSVLALIVGERMRVRRVTIA